MFYTSLFGTVSHAVLNMTLQARFRLLLILVLCWTLGHAQTGTSAPQAPNHGDIRYLLVRRAGRPEKNYYDLQQAPRFLEPGRYNEEMLGQYKPSPDALGVDISGRYGNYQAWKVRWLSKTTSVELPSSPKPGMFVLSYPRNPDWVFCARSYQLSGEGSTRRLTYVDFQSGREYTVELGKSWPRPWDVSRIEILNDNAFLEIWKASFAASPF